MARGEIGAWPIGGGLSPGRVSDEKAAYKWRIDIGRLK